MIQQNAVGKITMIKTGKCQHCRFRFEVKNEMLAEHQGSNGKRCPGSGVKVKR